MALRACDGVRVMSVTFLPHSCYLLMSEIRLLESPTFLTALPIYMYLYLVAYLSVKLQYNVHAIGSLCGEDPVDLHRNHPDSPQMNPGDPAGFT